MKALIQRVTHASVVVDGSSVGEIEQGILAYIGLGHDDTLIHAKRMIDKILGYRIFENTVDEHKRGLLDLNVEQVGGGLLLVSQFTLMARTQKGRRPDFGDAMAPDAARDLFAELVDYAKSKYPKVATGEFGANMQVSSTNDGPLNFILEIN
ncbi:MULTISPECIES: D-aminoacyl-tRNA deacylase [unclassified Psychrobacter]|uniref:D-aminoacyl-tRNA deacylase n=1 Tax=unclassified Psychrobacter TaxID=196806 RepID=UPI0018F53A85|nr:MULTISPECIES: D-aminoacyl-tRNA deacylase [unclassified Psychrobacter]